MKHLRVLFFAAVFGLLSAVPQIASAQIRVGSHLAFNFDGSDLAIGANAQVGFNAGERRLIANPSADFYLFKKNASVTMINLDVAYPFIQNETLDGPSVSPYIGAGVVVRRISFDVPQELKDIGLDCSDLLTGCIVTDFVINVFIGSLFMTPESPIRPFARVAANLGAGTGVAIQGGATFRITD